MYFGCEVAPFCCNFVWMKAKQGYLISSLHHRSLYYFNKRNWLPTTLWQKNLQWKLTKHFSWKNDLKLQQKFPSNLECNCLPQFFAWNCRVLNHDEHEASQDSNQSQATMDFHWIRDQSATRHFTFQWSTVVQCVKNLKNYIIPVLSSPIIVVSTWIDLDPIEKCAGSSMSSTHHIYTSHNLKRNQSILYIVSEQWWPQASWT